MHIPDGYLSPQTCAVLGMAMLPVWSTAIRRVRYVLHSKHVPLMVVGAAFSFIIMMFNVPIPDGTTGHAVGGAILAVIMGPWAASICITIALAIQALLFGDGGIWAFGANCFNIAFVLPFGAYYVYRLIAGNSKLTSSRRWVGGLVGGYVGLNLAALAAAVEFGLQPLLFRSAGGAPLYCPYPLDMAVPAMALAHLVVAGPIEGVVTALFIRYQQAGNVFLLNLEGATEERLAPVCGRFWGGLLVLVVLSPLGLLARGTAWGEWSLEEVRQVLGFVPAGMERLAEKWQALMPDYTLVGLDGTFWQTAGGYILAAVAGVVVVAGVTSLFGRLAGAGAREMEREAKGRAK